MTTYSSSGCCPPASGRAPQTPLTTRCSPERSSLAAVALRLGQPDVAARYDSAKIHVGCGSVSDYVERPFGYKPRTNPEKVRVAEALEGLPEKWLGGSRPPS